jgi:hypothetical protein
MRSSNLKMGSILPEYNRFKPNNLQNNSAALGLNKKRMDFKQTGSTIVPTTSASQKVSDGTNFARG